MRFCWDGHRGILCIKNENIVDKLIEVRIEGMHEKEVIFEKDKEKKFLVENCKALKHIYIYFIRRKDREIGRFFRISLHN